MSTQTDPIAGTRRLWPPNGQLSAWIAGHFAPGFKGYCVDVGASDGISVNSTLVLEEERWTVVSVEPNPCFHESLKQRRAMVETCAIGTQPGTQTFYSFNQNPEAYSALKPTFPSDFPLKFGDGQPSPWTTFEVQVKTLEQVLERWQFPRLDVLCIDTEGTERDVLESFYLAKWAPRVIVVEAWKEGSLDEYLNAFGYERQGRTADNDLYVRKEATDGNEDRT